MTDEKCRETEIVPAELSLKDREDGVEVFTAYIQEIEAHWDKAFTKMKFEVWFEKLGCLTEEEFHFAVKELICRPPGYHLPVPADVLAIVRPNLQPVEALPPRVEMTEEERAAALELLKRFKGWTNG
jgi:hypothetical protein